MASTDVADTLEGFDLGQLTNLSSALSEKAGQGERVIEIDPEKTRDNPYQPRTILNPEADAELEASVRASGITQPIVVLPPDTDGIRTVVTGHRRRDASRSAGQTCPAIERLYSDDELEAMAAIENIQRENMVLSDEVAVVARIAEKHGNKEAARILGKTPGYVSKAVKICKTTGPIVELLRAGHSSDAAAFYELALLHSKAPEVADAIAQQWQDDPEQRVSLRAQVAEAKAAVDAPAKETNGSVEKNPVKDKKEKAVKALKPQHFCFEPDVFHVAHGVSGGRVLTFELDDGSTVAVELSEQKWGAFVNEVNA